MMMMMIIIIIIIIMDILSASVRDELKKPNTGTELKA